jgi:hypothetical protein
MVSSVVAITQTYRGQDHSPAVLRDRLELYARVRQDERWGGARQRTGGQTDSLQTGRTEWHSDI